MEVWQLDADESHVSEHTSDLEEMAKYWVVENLNPDSCKPIKVFPYDWDDFSNSNLLYLASNDKYVAMLMTKKRIEIFDSTDLS